MLVQVRSAICHLGQMSFMSQTKMEGKHQNSLHQQKPHKVPPDNILS